MATRFYFPKAGSAASSPSIGTGWEYTGATFVRRPLAITKAETGYAAQEADTWPGLTSETGDSVTRQFVSAPLDVDQTVSGTYSFVMEGWESDTTADASFCVGIRVLQGDTSTERGTIKSAAQVSGEFDNSAGYTTRIASAVAITTVNALAGDRIVIELGFHWITPGSTSYNAAALIGAISGGTDLALTAGTVNSSPSTSTKVPWLELSSTLTFASDVAPSATIAFTTDDAIVAAAGEISNIASVAFTTDDATVAATGTVPSEASVAFTTDDATAAAAGTVDGAASVAFTTDDSVIAITGDSGASTATIAFTTDDATVAAVGALSNDGTVAFTTDSATFAATGTTTAAPPTEVFSVTVRDAVTGAKLTGLTTVYISVQRDTDGYRFDFTDNQFRAASAVPTLAMDEFSAANAPGYYTKALQVLMWTGDITLTIEYNDGTRITTWVASSVEYLAGVRINTGSRATPADIVAATDTLEASIAALPSAVLAAAATTPIAANVKKVNDTSIGGAGTTASPWGPV